MYEYTSHQMSITDDPTLFVTGCGLDVENEWVKLAQLIPWHELEKQYAETFTSAIGNPGIPCRMAVGTLIIKHSYGLSDRDTIKAIQMNPYLQYFIGLSYFQHEAPMDPSSLTNIRKRLPPQLLQDLNDYVIGYGDPYVEDESDDHGSSSSTSSTTGSDSASSDGKSAPTNEGTLLLDATCVPQDIRYPTDVSLLNEAREKADLLIDHCHAAGTSEGKKRPRTYRQTAQKKWKSFARKRRPSRKVIRKATGQQLGYLARNLRFLDGILAKYPDVLDEKQQEQFRVLQTLYAQQKYMYDNKKHSVEDRIVSLHQPWVRPIVRGKAKADTEFGSKLACSEIDGYLRVEQLSWDAFYEGNTLEASCERYYEALGYYPEKVIVDQAYRTRKNIQYCKSRGITISGRPLGRPPKDERLRKQQHEEERADASIRNSIEGSFGVCKRRFGLGLVRERLQATSEVSIQASILTMNLWRRLRLSLFSLIYFLHQVLKGRKLQNKQEDNLRMLHA